MTNKESRRDTLAGDSDHIVAETAARIFAELADPQTINRAKDDAAWKEPLWRALEEAGLTLAWVPENLGGSGASLGEGFAVLGEAGRHAVSVPLAETMLAGWLLARAGVDSPTGAMSIAPVRTHESVRMEGERLHGQAVVPFAPETQHIAVLADSKVVLVATEACRVGGGRNLAGEPAPMVDFSGAKPLHVAPSAIEFEEFLLMGAGVRAMQTAGTLQTILSMSVAYADERVAFERKIGKFQAVQQNLARLAGEAAAALAAAGSAAGALADHTASEDAVFLEIASAKIRCAEAATEGSAIAHQVFGAIGFTQEHVLHRFTLRVLGWRDDFGNESWWAAELGRRVARRGADEFWPLVASR
jgi:acyl-CoA dehydrogenase